jgi:hypothetical protein
MSAEQRPVVGDGRAQLLTSRENSRFSAFKVEPFPTRILGRSSRVIFLVAIGYPVIVHTPESALVAPIGSTRDGSEGTGESGARC